MTEPAFKIIGHFEIAKLQLNHGDVLVIKSDRRITPEQAKNIREHLKSHLPEGVKALVINPEIELSVLTKSDLDALA